MDWGVFYAQKWCIIERKNPPVQGLGDREQASF